MCWTVIRHLQLILGLLARQQQIANQIWVGKSATALLLDLFITQKQALIMFFSQDHHHN